MTADKQALALLRELDLFVDFSCGWSTCDCFPDAVGMDELCERIAEFLLQAKYCDEAALIADQRDRDKS